MGSSDSFPVDFEVKLDGAPVELPPERRSFRAVRSYLECLALQQQRLLCWITVDGEPINLTQPGVMIEEFSRVEAETMSLEEVPAQLIKGALHQTAALRARMQSAVDLMLINEGIAGRELWWTLTTALKEPLLTLSLVPDTICGPENGRASLIQLRKWQLQQLGSVIEDVDQACSIGDAAVLSEALESRALPWIDQLHASLELWSETVSCHSESPVCRDSHS
ncbi:MAG TPA: hypothetical protein VFD66_02390 [Verrucomicrobiae bacterium]|nr:hypothetical protein [Verrucomicrobiae bacterium]